MYKAAVYFNTVGLKRANSSSLNQQQYFIRCTFLTSFLAF